MTISANNFTFDHVPGVEKSVTVHFHTTDPGEFAVDYPDGITGPATVEAAGTRSWGNMGSGGDYLAMAAVGQSRLGVTIGMVIDLAKLKKTNTSYTNTFGVETLAASFRQDTQDRYNWAISTWQAKTTAATRYSLMTMLMSRDSASGVSVIKGNISQLSTTPVVRILWVLPATGDTIYNYYNARATVTAVGRPASTTGTMGGDEVLVFYAGNQLVKWDRELSNDDIDLWFAGSVPATPSLAYLGGHEIDPASPVIYDSSANAYDLTATQITNWQAPGMRGDYTDDPLNPVMPYQAIAINALKTGTTTITARRRRQGIPYRTPALPDAEVYETTTYNLTVIDALSSDQSIVQLMIYADRDGVATITMDNPIIGFPASANVVFGKNQISGLVTGAGTCNVTVTMNGVSDVTTFVIEAIGTWIKAGPAQEYLVYLP